MLLIDNKNKHIKLHTLCLDKFRIIIFLQLKKLIYENKTYLKHAVVHVFYHQGFIARANA
jgi:hypothetical protein